MRKWIRVVGALLVMAGILSLCMQSLAQVEKGERLPIWTPDRDLLSKLTEAVSILGFQVRPPKGYTSVRQVEGRAQMFAWQGSVRSDGTAPSLMVGIMTPPPGEASTYTLEELLDKFLAGIQRRRQHWTRTAAERGQVNGLPFVRARWSGTETTSQRKMHGFNYVALEGQTIIHISSQDVEPHHDAALAFAETAALTFKRMGRGD